MILVCFVVNGVPIRAIRYFKHSESTSKNRSKELRLLAKFGFTIIENMYHIDSLSIGKSVIKGEELMTTIYRRIGVVYRQFVVHCQLSDDGTLAWLQRIIMPVTRELPYTLGITNVIIHATGPHWKLTFVSNVGSKLGKINAIKILNIV